MPSASGPATPSGAGSIAPLSPPVKVRFADTQIASLAGLYVGLQNGYFDQQGLQVDLIKQGGLPELISQLAAGQLDFGGSGPDPAIFNAMARGIPLKFVLGYTTYVKGNALAGMVVRQDLLDSGRYKAPKDLRGMNIAVGSLAGSSQLVIEKMLALGGLTINDVRLTVLTMPDTVVALGNKGVDAAYIYEPFITTSLKQGTSRTVIPVGDVLDGADGYILVSPELAKSQPEVARRFVTAFVHGMRDYWHAFNKNDGNRDNVLQALTHYTVIKDPSTFLTMAEHDGLAVVDPNAAMHHGSVSQFQDYFVRNGAQKDPVDVESMFDATYLNYALDRLGRVTQ